MPPLVVVEASAQAFAHALREVEAAGWQIVHGWRAARGAVCAGAVRHPRDAAEAVLAAVAGAGVVAHAETDRELVDRLVDDLRRFGPVDHRTAEPPQVPLLTRDEQELLGLLMDGMTLGAAARQLHLSRRTADRRLASARRTLGVATTAEALVAFQVSRGRR